MTDLERFIELYRSFGIECKVGVRTWENGPRLIHKNEPLTRQVIQLGGDDFGTDDYGITPTQSGKFDGYGGFYSSVEFDMEGKFIEQGFWE